MRFILFILFFICLNSAAKAQVLATAAVDSTHLLIGDQVKMHLGVKVPANVEMEPLSFKVLEGTPFEVLAESKWDTTERGASYVIRKNIAFTAWEPGHHRFPPLPVYFVRNGKRDSTFSREIFFEVDSPLTAPGLADSLKSDTLLADIKPILVEPSKWQDFLPHIGVVVALLILAWLIIMARRKKVEVVAPPPRPMLKAPHEIALLKLEALKNKQLWQNGQVKAYYSELTFILREYLENRYSVQALEITSDEIMAMLKGIEVEEEPRNLLKNILSTADMVKFAKAQPPPLLHDQRAIEAKDFLLATKSNYIVAEVPEELQGDNGGGQVSASQSYYKENNDLPNDVELAGFWRRYFAFAIDMWLPGLILLLSLFSSFFVMAFTKEMNIFIPFVALLIMVFYAYFVLMDYYKGGSIGKLILGISVRQQNGQKISFGQANARFFGRIISIIFLFLGFVPYFFDKKYRRTLHDRLAGTIVVKKKKPDYKNTPSKPLDSID